MDRFIIKRPRLAAAIIENVPEEIAVPEASTSMSVDTENASTAIDGPPAHDPASRFAFSRLTGKYKDLVIARGPHQPNFTEIRLKKCKEGTEHELSRGGRYFQQRYYAREGNWVEYSIKENAIFCFPCRLFTPESGNKRDAFSYDGFTSFKNADARLQIHEQSETHIAAVNRLRVYRPTMSTSNISAQLNAEVQKTLSKVQKRKQQLRDVFLRIFSAVLFLSKQNIAFRGHNEMESSRNRGNFLELITTMSHCDPVLENFLDSKKKKPGKRRRHKTYLSPESQNRFINLLAGKLREHLGNTVNAAGFYSLQLDSTRDVAGHEQVSLILRVATNKGESRQYFFGFYQCTSQTAASLEKFILDTLEQLQIPLHFCRCVNFDGASNMSGRLNGLQARICRLVPKAIYFHCAAHRLNLVVVSACHSVKEAVNFFGTVQAAYNFIACAPTRLAVYEEAWKELEELRDKRMLTLKSLCEVRWGCQRRALRVFSIGYPAMMYSVNTSLETMTDAKAMATGRGIASQLMTFEFAFCLQLFQPLLEMTGICSDMFSAEDLDLCQMLRIVENLLKQLQNERSDEGFEKCWKATEEFAVKHGIEAACQPRQKYVSKRIEANPTSHFLPSTVKESLRIRVFYPVYDTMITEISRRFNDASKPLVSAFSALFPKNLLTESNESSETKVGLLLDHYGDDFEEPQKLLPEWKLFRQVASSTDGRASFSVLQSLGEITCWMTAEGHATVFKNVFQLYRISITLGLTTVKNERAFSKLKLLETHLRSSMAQDRLSSLGLLAVEHEELASMNIANVIDEYVDTLDVLH
jgi:hypothetical protein